MGTLYLVRHGQASFGAADYDQLSPLGTEQSRRLGEWFAQQGIAPQRVWRGSLKRHAQTWEGLAEGAGFAHQPEVRPGLNEYDSDAVVKAIHPGPLTLPDKATAPEAYAAAYRAHFRLLREGLAAWMQGRTAPQGMPTYAEFVRGIVSVLDEVRESISGDGVALIVSSGGPISTAVGQVLGTSPETTIELNLRIRNTSVTEFAFTPKRHMLVTYNTLPHLDAPERRGMITSA